MIRLLRSVERKCPILRCNSIGRKVITLMLLALLPGCSLDVKKSETIDLRNVERSHSPNDALACPPRLCRAEADFESPIFQTTKTELINQARKLITAEDPIRLLTSWCLSSVPDYSDFRIRFGSRVQASTQELRSSSIVGQTTVIGIWGLIVSGLETGWTN